ncbi:MAG: dTDP-4-dehydrorhamnose 3,5-epimerase [Methylocystis sp.]|nr:MAG: dTDP-4-dehydrorhamnose 3,5-epimerase [Methylocystis sp.]
MVSSQRGLVAGDPLRRLSRRAPGAHRGLIGRERRLRFEALDIEGPILITPKKFGDERGFFSETHNAGEWERAGLHHKFVQDAHSLSRDVGTIRGMHFQRPPFAQDKLVRVSRGRILDVAVDLRRSSEHFGRHVAVELSAENWRQLFIPAGFAHGFATLEPDTEVLYKFTNFYSPAHDAGVLWNDPDIGIEWTVDAARAILSAKDVKWPRLRDLSEAFP